MQVGILTFHKTTNYGAILQAYALQKTLENEGFKVSIIDYHNNRIYGYYDYRIRSCNHYKTMIGKIIRYHYNKAIWLRFEAFRHKHIKLSPSCQTLNELQNVESVYNAVISGSDQVWNPNAIFQDFDAYLLGTVSCKKIAYAASAGNVMLWEKYLKTYWNLLHRFDAISVREADMVHPVRELSQQEVTLVCDPTLLLEQSDWVSIEQNELNKSLPNGYILVYFLGRNISVPTTALALQKKTGLPIVSIGRKIKGAYRPKVGPAGFLSLFHHATYILTSSFHGTVFSIQYQKPFLVFGNGAYNSRMHTLLNHLNLQERLITNNCSIGSILSDIDQPIDWEKVAVCRFELKGHSIGFIKKSLS
ncbi:polysaccharide pyruvyl transferase family protein [Bacteroides sp. AN502(2024)]|uniref:polysaccharide pyruvyl transferase family protein n=1 Tax=Bacteroides sp. AN502(2024) TaxID=3160599 RepID=UPI003511EC9D